MTSSGGMEFRILGPLEARIDGESISLGGAKQRAVLAALLLRANEVISVERLTDEVWGEESPPSASHSLEAYVSRIRQALNGHGPTLTRRGAGYRLDLGDAVLDADTFARRLEDAADAAGDRELERASALAGAALALWHGPALADVSLASAGRAEAERLEEQRLRAFELRFDAELELGRHEAVVGELQLLVGQNPYRERFVAQLMLALYHAGRQAEALDAYEQTRRRLDEDLGLQPSTELQQLSGQIVRQEVQLRIPATGVRTTPRGIIRPRARRLSGPAVVGAAAVAAMAVTASGSAPPPATAAAAAAPTSIRVALVLPRAAKGRRDDLMTRYLERFRSVEYLEHSLTKETIVADEIDPEPATLDTVTSKLHDGAFDLVLWVGDGAAARALAPEVRKLPDTRFVFIDGSLETLSLTGAPNARAVRFADEEASQLAGYLSGLVAPRGDSRGERADVVSVVGGMPTSQSRRVIAGFERGVRRALPGVEVLVGLSNEAFDQTRCEQIANSQIDKGSDVVFVAAGRCGLGALAVARTRGVWGVGEEAVPGQRLPAHMLAYISKDYERAVDVSMDSFVLGGEALQAGEDFVLGLDDNYAVEIWGSDDVPQGAWSKVVRLCSNIRQHTRDDAP